MTVLTNPDDIAAYRLLVLHKGLSLETKGIKMSRGRSCYSIIKDEFGLKGNKISVLDQFTKLLQEQNVLRK
jgi:hypothetical protein